MNAAPTFDSPLRPAGVVNVHANPPALITHCMSEAQAITVRKGHSGPGMDAMTFIVVENDNVNWSATKFYSKSPAPQVGHPLHYASFLQTICSKWRARFE